MPLPPLTPDQKAAAYSDARRLLIEATPGTGKTRVATERFGVLRFRPSAGPGSGQGVLVLSFTVAATELLRRRIRQRWGRRALAWPNRVCTLDAVFRGMLEFLLRSGRVQWPAGLTAIRVIESWRGFGERRLNTRGSLWLPALVDGCVVPTKRTGWPGDYGMTTKKELQKQLEDGLCTHDDVRSIIRAALKSQQLRPHLLTYAKLIASSVLVDEIFDGNSGDSEVLALFTEAGCEITLVGDPWQALYAFRLAEPEMVRQLLIKPYSFHARTLNTSFRFETAAVADLAAALRRRERIVTLPPIGSPDVVLAAEWTMLWATSPGVLPMAFGQIQSGVGAAVSLALDYFLRKQFGEGARLLASASTLLRIDPGTYLAVAEDTYGPILERLRIEGESAAEWVLDELCGCVKSVLGAPRRPTLTVKGSIRYAKAIGALASRVRYSGRFVPGITVHQAKGQEWNRVAVVLGDDDRARLAKGLNPDDPDDRRLYVSLTRGRVATGTLSINHGQIH
jgi:DNA helicase-2/ATP-dependent DNA helicase PcrA